MKIVKLSAENFKRLSAVEITPTGNIVELSGKNGQGKSSVLDAIWVALAGLGVAPKKPIKTGELESRIVLTLGAEKPEIVVTRTFRPSKDGGEVTSTLKVESADGAKYASPQAMLDKLLGALAFDPLAFERMDARAQFNALRAFVPGFDFEAIDMAQRGDFDRRTHQNRIAKDARAAAAAIALPPGSNAERIDEGALVVQLESAGQFNTDIETRKANRTRMADEITSLSRSISAEEEMIKDLEQRLAGSRKRIEDYLRVRNEKQSRLDAAGALPAPIDTAELRQKIEHARRANARIDEVERAQAKRNDLLKQALIAEQTAATLTESIDMREVKKREAIAAAKLPVPGLSFGDNEILLNGEPFSQASDAERLCCSIAMAMAMNPKLRIIRVRDGSLLDADSMKLLAKMAQESDHQVWIERVDGSGRVGVVIEDGRVKSTEGSTT